MDFDGEEGFPGLYNAESGRRSNESDYSDGDHEKPSKKDLLIGRRKDKKDSKKDRGYAALAGESSPEEDVETKSPSKSKKTKAFKFPTKSKEKREKSRDKEKVGEKEVKEKEKEKEMLEREKKKEKIRKEKEKREKEKEEKMKIKESKEKVKDKEKEKVKEKDKDKKERKGSNKQPTIAAGIPFEEMFTLGVAQPIFGVSLGLAVERSRCHDDTNLPLVVRDCIDFLQEHGLNSESVYRVEPAKQRILILRKLYNDRELVTENDYEVSTACALLKLFITELPEPVLTTELCGQFEDAVNQPPAAFIPLISQLPSCNRALLGWLISHIASVLSHDKLNRLSMLTVGTLLGPTLNMSQSLLTYLVTNAKLLFSDVKLTKYMPPLTHMAPKLPESAEEITKELRKQESLLNQIHAEMHAGFVTQKREEQLWEGQRIVTQLKRKLRAVQKTSDPSCFSQTHSIEDRQHTFDEDRSEKLPSAENSSQVSLSSSEERVQAFKPINVTVPNDIKTPTNLQEKSITDSKHETKVAFPVDNFEDNFEEVTDPNPITSKNEMTDSVYSTSSETAPSKSERPSLSEEELQLMRLQLEHAEFLQLKSILQAKINSERFEIVKLRSHMAIKNKQENNGLQNNFIRDPSQPYTESEIEERHRLMKENAILEQKRLSLVNQIYQDRTACIEMRIQLAMNEIL